MSWGRFEAHVRAHAKCRKAGNEAASFWIWAILWAHDNKTDGYIDGSLLGDVMPIAIANEKAKELAEICAKSIIKPGGAGLFERVEGGAYIIHDFHHFQPPADEELAKVWHQLSLSEKRSVAGKKGALARWQKEMAKVDGKSDDTFPRVRARVGSEGIGSVGTDSREGSAEGRGDVPEAVEPEAPVEPETTYDLAWRLWRELYQTSRRKYGRYIEAGVTDDRAIQLLAHRADDLTGADRAKTEALLRHWFSSYLLDDGEVSFIVNARHPVKFIERRLPTYGEPKPPRKAAPPAPRESEPDGQGLDPNVVAERARTFLRGFGKGPPIDPKEPTKETA